MGFSRQEYWSGLPFPSPGDLLNPVIGPGSPALQADFLLFDPSYFEQLYPNIKKFKLRESCYPISFSEGLTWSEYPVNIMELGEYRWVARWKWGKRPGISAYLGTYVFFEDPLFHIFHYHQKKRPRTLF